MAERIVYVRDTIHVFPTAKHPLPPGQDTYQLVRGEAFDASHPLVKARPDLFLDVPPDVTTENGIERATARPGEKRTTRRA